MKNINKMIMLIIGTLIGAGFASGREIYLFFFKYGYLGLIGIVISALMTSYVIIKVLNIIQEKSINNYSDFLEKINYKNKKINKYICFIVNSFLLISFYIMIAGFSAYIKQIYDIPAYLSSLFFVIICYIVFSKSLKGVMEVSNFLVPIILILIIYLGIKNIPYLVENKIYFLNEKNNINNISFIVSSLLYMSYNSIVLIPILVTMKEYIINKKQIKLIGILTGVLIIILSYCIYGLLLRNPYIAERVELPLLEITLEFGNVFKFIYGFIIIISIFTSAISTGYSFLENITKDKKEYNVNLLLICITGIIISNFGFSNLIKILYPLFGVLGLLQIILLNSIEKKSKN